MLHSVGVVFTLVAVMFYSSGCGVMFGGTRQAIDVNSTPTASSVTGDPSIGEYSTPASISLERKSNYVLTFQKEGYESATFTIRRQIRAGIVILDVLFTGLVGVIVDAATGAWYSLSPKVVKVSLTKVAMIDGPERIDISFIMANDNEREVLSVTSSEPDVLIKVEPLE